MPLSAKKQAKAERAKREAYVLSVAIHKGDSYSPFGDANWDDAARRYIETGDESLKDHFPTYRRRDIKETKR